MKPTRPPASSPEVTARLSGQVRKNTGLEMTLRRVLHARGLRYRLHVPVSGRPRRTVDITFPRQRVAVFLDGCFWHGCPDHGSIPKSNSAWWLDKLDRNRQRDADTNAHLRAHGWTVLRFWEHEDVMTAADVIESVVRRPS
ncbi:very short patch repair endonuclease [Nonomuraea sp. NPDC048916]|uniref:very short patch repair endonuclease n=1 Tax=Nonomuraea sp. NPDC048916 TaxID=3154232 RepID=UPI0033C5CB69